MKSLLLKYLGPLALALLVSSCGRSLSHDRLDNAPLPPGTVVTPGEDDDAEGDNSIDADLRRELEDDCPRITLGTLSLRYDRGGVLVGRSGDGTVKFVDLDGTGDVRVNVERSQLLIDSREVDGVEFTLLRSYGGVEWYRVSGGPSGILVVPAR